MLVSLVKSAVMSQCKARYMNANLCQNEFRV